MIRVLIVDDSALMRKILERILRSDPEIRVAGCACSGEEALAFLATERADVVTMDIHMGGMDGFEATRRIMESDAPRPVVIVSSCWDPMEVEKTFQAMDAGAVAILPKPADIASGAEEYARELLETIKTAAQSTVARLRKRSPQPTFRKAAAARKRDIRIAAIGASTGGTEAIREVITRFPVATPGVVIVQHMPAGFTKLFSERMNTLCQMEVKEAENDDRVMPGRILISSLRLCTSTAWTSKGRLRSAMSFFSCSDMGKTSKMPSRPR